jgi:hypothetical protein
MVASRNDPSYEQHGLDKDILNRLSAVALPPSTIFRTVACNMLSVKLGLTLTELCDTHNINSVWKNNKNGLRELSS